MAEALNKTQEITQSEFARLSGVTRNVVWKAIRAGYVKVNQKRKVVFNDESTQRWYQRQIHVDDFESLDNKKHYLGELCPRGHLYINTPQSIRYMSDKSCVKCRLLAMKTETSIKRKRRYAKGYNKRESTKESYKKYSAKTRDDLTDSYVKSTFQHHNIKRADITPEMIELKRELMLFNRLKREVLSGVNSRRDKRTEADGQRH